MTETRSGGFTQVPNVLLDDLMSRLTGGELKVLLYIIRRTIGFGKTSDRISLGQICGGLVKNGKICDEGTGLSRGTVVEALRSLEQKGAICRSSVRPNTRSTYRVTLEAPCPDVRSGPKTGPVLVQKPDQIWSGNPTTQKKGKKGKETTPPTPSPTSQMQSREKASVVGGGSSVAEPKIKTSSLETRACETATSSVTHSQEDLARVQRFIRNSLPSKLILCLEDIKEILIEAPNWTAEQCIWIWDYASRERDSFPRGSGWFKATLKRKHVAFKGRFPEDLGKSLDASIPEPEPQPSNLDEMQSEVQQRRDDSEAAGRSPGVALEAENPENAGARDNRITSMDSAGDMDHEKGLQRRPELPNPEQADDPGPRKQANLVDERKERATAIRRRQLLIAKLPEDEQSALEPIHEALTVEEIRREIKTLENNGHPKLLAHREDKHHAEQDARWELLKADPTAKAEVIDRVERELESADLNKREQILADVEKGKRPLDGGAPYADPMLVETARKQLPPERVAQFFGRYRLKNA